MQHCRLFSFGLKIYSGLICTFRAPTRKTSFLTGYIKYLLTTGLYYFQLVETGY